MNLADKPCYPVSNHAGIASDYQWTIKSDRQYGLTFRERLIIALASNPEMFLFDGKSIEISDAVEIIIESADRIIKEMEK